MPQKRNPCVENQRLHHRRFPRRNANKGTFHFKCHKTHTGTFDIPEIHNFLERIDCKTIKAKSTDKADIRIVIHDLNTGSKPELGYSIKSKLGGNSTLINANKDSTNFIYQVINVDHSQMSEFNKLGKFGANSIT